MSEELTAYCGLYCADCIPSRKDFFKLVDRLAQMLEELQFDQYAELITVKYKEFKGYPTFLSILDRMKDLRCTAPCRQGGGNSQCKIRQCVQSNELNGCWECQKRRSCILLDHLRGVHANLDFHLDLIVEKGPVRWAEKRKEHYRWQCKGDVESIALANMDKPC